MISRNYSNPNIPTKHLPKDIDLFLSEGQSMNIETVALEGVRRLLTITLDRGYAEEGYSAIYNAIIHEEE